MENSIFFGLPEVPKISHFCVVKNKRQLFCQRIAIIASNIAWGVICQASRIGFILVLLSILLSIGVFLAMESPGHGSHGIPERPPPFNWNLDPYIVPMFPVGQHPQPSPVRTSWQRLVFVAVEHQVCRKDWKPRWAVAAATRIQIAWRNVAGNGL